MEENNEKIVKSEVKEEINSNINPKRKNNNIKIIAIVIIMLILVLAVGIGVGLLISDKGNVNNNNTENTVKEQEKTKEKTQDNTQDDTQDNTQEQNESNNKITLNEEEMYKSIINDYKNAVSEYNENDIEILEKIESKYSMVNSTIVFLVNRYPELGPKIAYTFYDIDKNGIKELIVGIRYNTDRDLNEGAIYSYNTNSKKVEKIYYQDTMERGHLYIYDNGIIFSEGSGGAYVHAYRFGEISENGYSFEELENIEEEYTQENSNPVYRDYKANKVLNYRSLDEIKTKYLKNSNAIKFIDYVELETNINSQNVNNSTQNNSQPTATSNNTTVNKEYDVAITEIKKCLKDEQWLKNNIYIQKNEMIVEDGNILDQEINFLVCKKSSIPVVVVQASSDNARFTKLLLVTYKNGKVTVEGINQGHIYHGDNSVDANKYVVCSSFMHMGDNSITLRSISEGNINFLGGYGYQESYVNENEVTEYYIYDSNEYAQSKKVTQEDYEKHKKELNVEQYNFVSVSTKLTNQNIDKYIK